MSSDRIRDSWRESILQSALPPRARLVALVYADHAADDGSQVWVDRSRLEARTGIPRRTLTRDLAVLADGGWLVETAAARQHFSARYRLGFPCGQPSQRSHSGTSEGGQSGTPEPARVANDVGRVASPAPDPQPQQLQRSAREGGGVITDPADHDPRSSTAFADRLRAETDAGYSDEVITRAVRRVQYAADCDVDAARGAVRRLVRRHKPRDLGRYLDKIIDTGDVAQLLAEPKQARSAKPNEVSRLIGQLESQGECEHGHPGGDQLHPSTRVPLCPLCRVAATALALA